jgi:hypothetical protein
MVTDLRAEVGHSLVSGQGTNMEDTLKYNLKRTQYELYRAHDWPAFIIDEQQAVPANTRHLDDFAQVDKEQINAMWCKQGTEWYPITYGIDPMHYSLYDPDNNVVGFPIQRYKYDELGQKLEIWPLTSIDTTVLARGQILLPPLVDNADTSLLDGTLIVMFAAAHMLSRQQDEDAPLMQQKAQAYLTSILKNQGSQKRPTMSMARADGGRRPRAGIDYIPRQPRV